MGGKNTLQKDMEKYELVHRFLTKRSPLTPKQEKLCDGVCVERFLKARGGSAKKAARQLRAWLSWRDCIGADNLIADEFTAELSEGAAYIAGLDEEQARPVAIFRIKQEYQKLHSPKMLTRLLAFTLEVAMATKTGSAPAGFVLLFDASLFRSASAFTNLLTSALRMVADYYPGLLSHAFVIDPPSLFPHLWKGVRAFVELSSSTTIVWSSELKKSTQVNDTRRETGPTSRTGSSSSSRFSFTVSAHTHPNSLKPWYLSFADSSSSKVGPTLSSQATARSLSFGSRPPPTSSGGAAPPPLTPLPEGGGPASDNPPARHQRTPWPSFLQSPGIFNRREGAKAGTTPFLPFLELYLRPYDEAAYRAKMKPPLGGLISLIPPHLRPRHVSASQRFI